MRFLLVPIGLLLLNACSAQSASEPEVPAVISEPTAQSRAELQRLVRRALHGAEVTLADDALTGSSTLIIERSPKQQPALGRNLEKPRIFRLFLSNGHCWLERKSDGERWELPEANCVPSEG